jgi:protein-disulfide isomerase
VVFESFRCPGCRRLAATLSRLRSRFNDRLLVVYKHYPLSTECNARLTRDMQPGACEIAWAAEAAHRQARFWPFHDAVFSAGGDASPDGIASAARKLRLDPARFAADCKSAATRERVAEDIALGDRLQIPGTPAVFIDGRLAPSTGAEALEILIGYKLGLEESKSRPRDRDDVGLVRPGTAGGPS